MEANMSVSVCLSVYRPTKTVLFLTSVSVNLENWYMLLSDMVME